MQRREGKELAMRPETGMELPYDVEIEILQRLPVKPLRRLELVSKNWRRLIRSRYFMERYMVHQKSKHRFKILAKIIVVDPLVLKVSPKPRLFLRSSDDDPEFTYVLLENNEVVATCLSCDGFICCPRPGNKYLFINPATGQKIQAEQRSLCHRPQTFESHVTVPFICRYSPDFLGYRMSNHQFPSPAIDLLGFGRDRVSGDYKLVRLFERPGENTACTECEVLSLKTWEWRYISHVPIPCFKGQPSASVNGSIYWFTVYLWLTDAEYSTTAKIIAFDLHTHRFRAVHHPPFGARTPSYIINLMNLRDQVWMVEQTLDCLEMWSMDGGGGAWEKMYSIDLKSYARPNLEVLMPITICGDGKVLISGKKPNNSNHWDLKERLLKYDPRTKTLLLADHQTFARVPYFQTWVLAPYFQSLFSFDTL